MAHTDYCALPVSNPLSYIETSKLKFMNVNIALNCVYELKILSKLFQNNQIAVNILNRIPFSSTIVWCTNKNKSVNK